ncbi:hypothetical protein ACIPVB_03215 [Microbacterium sp. NPDC090007]|uniref:hypothetical protein n=1 Tax=Microbacterium sp. NPDC090007 TaxID=3364204 RepID=UPI00382AEA0D
MSEDSEYNDSTPRLPSRRTIIAGAAWSVPAIAALSASPAAAASNDTVLTFDQASYSGQVCTTISGAYVTATTGGAAAAGKVVTVSLAGGFTFSGGSTSATGTTGGDGRFTLPTITVPNQPNSGTATATATGAAATSVPLQAKGTFARFMTIHNIEVVSDTVFDLIPSTAVPIGGYGLFLDGSTLWYGNSVFSSNISKARGNRSDTTDFFSYIENGVAKSAYGSNGSVTAIRTWANVPGTATPVGAYGTFLDNGNLWYFDAIVASGVDRAAGLSGGMNGPAQGQWQDYVGYFNNAARSFKGVNGTPQDFQAFFNVPSTVSATRMPNLWLNNNGDLWFANLRRESGVSNASGALRTNADDGTIVWTSNTPGAQDVSGYRTGNRRTFNSTPTNATAAGGEGVYVAGSDLWANNQKRTTNVAKAVSDGAPNGYIHISYVTNGC